MGGNNYNEDSRGHRVLCHIIGVTEIKPDNIQQRTGKFTLSSFLPNSGKVAASLSTLRRQNPYT